MSRPRVTRREIDSLARRIDTIDRKLDDVMTMLVATYRRAGPGMVGRQASGATAWDRALDVIATRVSPSAFFAWFRNTRQISDDGSTVSIEVPDHMTATWLTSHYRQVIDESFVGLGRPTTTVRIVVAAASQSY